MADGGSRMSAAVAAQAEDGLTPAERLAAQSEGIEKAEDARAGIEPSDIKVILLGDSAVGKSKILERFLLEEFSPRTRSTFALTLYRYNATLKESGKRVKVDFWDTAGQERFQSMHSSYYFEADACVLVFDVTRKATYQHLPRWYEELRAYCPKIPCFVVANKIDVDHRVTRKRFAWPTKNNLPLRFVSAADGTNVVSIFNDAIEAAVQYKQSGGDDTTLMMELLRGESFLDRKQQEQQGVNGIGAGAASAPGGR